MANDRQFQAHTRLVATWGVKPYRATIPVVVGPTDSVLEIGCEWGATSVLLAAAAGRLVATDLSSVCINRARHKHPHLSFEVLDAFDLAAVQNMGGGHFDKIYIDVSGLSGYRSLLDVLALVNAYSAVLQPETIVIKSGALLNLARRLHPWPPTGGAL